MKPFLKKVIEWCEHTEMTSGPVMMSLILQTAMTDIEEWIKSTC